MFVATTIAAAVIIIYYGWLTSAGYYPGGDSIATIPLWAASMIAGLTSMVLEAICPGQIDNIVTPVLVAVMMCLIGL